MASEIGQVTPGFRADLILVRSGRPHQAPAPDPYTALVYATRPTDVRTTIVDGEVLVSRGHASDPLGDGRRSSCPALGAEAKALAVTSVRRVTTANLVSCLCGEFTWHAGVPCTRRP